MMMTSSMKLCSLSMLVAGALLIMMEMVKCQ